MKNESTNQKIVRKAGRERGVALVAVMLTLLLITALVAAVVILGNTETATSSNFSDEQRAFFSAKAGIEEARDRLRTGVAGYSITTPTTLPGVSSTGVLYILNPLNSQTVAPWCGNSSPLSSACAAEYPDDELCTEALGGSGASSVTCTTDTTTGKKYASGSYYTQTTASTTLAPSSGSVLDWKWVRVTQKQSNSFGTGYYVNGSTTSTSQVFWNGNTECTSGSTCNKPVFVLTALAVTPSGSRRMVQMEVARDQINVTAPAALTMDGATPSFSGGTSANFGVSGIDAGGCGATTTSSPVPAVGVITNADVATVSSSTDIPSKTATNYTGLGYNGTTGTAPDVENVSTSTAYSNDDLNTVSNLQTLVSALKNDVTQPVVASGGSISNYGTQANPQIIYVNGNLTLTGSDPNPSKNNDGYGILVVTGTLTVKGTVAWDGLVLVVGQGDLEMDGTNAFAGSVIVAKTLDSSGNALTSLGVPTFNVHGGGSSNGGINYSAACLTNATQLTTYHSVSFRELIE